MNFFQHTQLIKVLENSSFLIKVLKHIPIVDSFIPGSVEKNFEVYSCKIEEPGFRSYHERLQTFLLWYVDAASFIDVDDDRWRFYLM